MNITCKTAHSKVDFRFEILPAEHYIAEIKKEKVLVILHVISCKACCSVG